MPKSHTAQSWNQIFKEHGRVFEEPLPEIIQFAEWLKVLELKRVLDLGCGSGRHVIYLRQQGFDVWGLDNAPIGLRMTQEWLIQERMAAPLVLADVHRPFPFCDNAFDAILSTRVIHHAMQEKAVSAVHEMKRILRPGGALLLAVPCSEKRKDRSELVTLQTYVPLEGREKGIPHYLFTPDELRELFADFKLCDVTVMEERLNIVRAMK